MEPIRTLIVDDDAAARRRIRHLLQADPDMAVVGECRTGRQAVHRLHRDGVDLVFLDVQMPRCRRL
ncbi:MAG: LytR/AlgR family response regulator transcription factor [Gemmatimonadales bacterium]